MLNLLFSFFNNTRLSEYASSYGGRHIVVGITTRLELDGPRIESLY